MNTAPTITSVASATDGERVAAVSTGEGARIAAETTATSPVEALGLEEVARVRIFFRSIVGTCIAAGASLPFLGGNATLEGVLAVALLICAVVCGHFYLRLRVPSRYTEGKATGAMLTCALVANVAILYWGVFSAAQMTIVILLYVFSRGRSARGATAVWAGCALTQGVCAALIISRVIDDPGLFRGDDLTAIEKLITHVIGQMVFLFTFWSGRLTRRASLDAIGKLENAVRQISRREAQLREAQHELDRARGVRGPGRFTSLSLGDYELGNVIGRGGMGEVYEARRIDNDDEAAVKVMRAGAVDDPKLIARFMREAEAASTLDSPHVVRILASSTADDDIPFLVMELLHGDTLAAQLRRKGRLELDEALAIIQQVGGVIDQAAEAGIVHRDLKPQNLLLTEEGEHKIWKVLDFGVSRLLTSSGTLTQGDIVGTPAYMAPEQARGAEVDSRADVYSLAAVIYRALTGVPPFQSDQRGSALFHAVFKAPVRPSSIASLSSDIDSFFAVALAKDPDDRFATGRQLHEAASAAFDGDLPDEIHDRADAILDELPWRELLDPRTAVTVTSGD